MLGAAVSVVLVTGVLLGPPVPPSPTHTAADGVELPGPDGTGTASEPADGPTDAIGSSGAATGPLRCAPAGCESWRHALPAPIGAIGGGHGLVVARVAGTLHAVDATTGDTRWTARLRGPSADGTYTVAFDAPLTVTVGADVVVVSGGPGWLQAREVADGSLRWSTQVAGPVTAVRLAGDGGVLASAAHAGDTGERVTALDPDTGRRLWSDTGDRRSAAVGRPSAVARWRSGVDATWLAVADRTLVVRGPQGSAHVSGAPRLVHEHPLVVADRRELLGLRLIGRGAPRGPAGGRG